MLTALIRITLSCLVCVVLSINPAFAAETIKFALIEPLSGPFANIGNNGLRGFVAEFDRINARAGVLGRNLELISFDNKSNPQETVQQL